MQRVDYEKLDEIAKRAIPQTPGYKESYELAQKVSGGGRVYVVGGAVYRNLINELYGRKSKIKDIDFLSMSPIEINGNTSGWTKGFNSFGQSKFFRNGFVTDIFSVGEVEHVKKEGLAHTLDSFFLGCPLNVQAIAYDPKEGRLEGEGIKAILEGTLRTHNKETLKRYCDLHKTSPIAYILSLRASIGFDAEIGKL